MLSLKRHHHLTFNITSSGKITVLMYSNSSILVSISFMGFDKDFFSMAQIPTMTCLPKLAPLAECDPLLLLSSPAAGPVRVALLPKASAKLLLEHPGVEVAVVGRCTPLDEVMPP